jgi:hypothetical protein
MPNLKMLKRHSRPRYVIGCTQIPGVLLPGTNAPRCFQGIIPKGA